MAKLHPTMASRAALTKQIHEEQRAKIQHLPPAKQFAHVQKHVSKAVKKGR